MDIQFYRKPQRKPILRTLVKAVWARPMLRWSLIIGLPILLFITFSNRGALQRIRLENEKMEWEQKVRAAEEEQLRLRQLSKTLDAEPSTPKERAASNELIEKIAREKYGMVKEGETVYKVKKEK